MSDEPRSNGERYSAAIASSDLKLRETGGDLDYIIAAGLVPDGLATALYRLTVEYDAQRAPIEAAQRWVAQRVAFANSLREEARQEAAKPEETQERGRVLALTAAFEEVQRTALAALHTEIILALSAMTTRRDARARLIAFALELAQRSRFNLSAAAVTLLAARILDVFLEPHCAHCDGRGFSGGGRHEHSGPQMICKPCRGTGTRRVDIGRDHAERRFAGHLLMSMDALMYEVQRAIGRNRRLVTVAKERIAQAQG